MISYVNNCFKENHKQIFTSQSPVGAKDYGAQRSIKLLKTCTEDFCIYELKLIQVSAVAF